MGWVKRHEQQGEKWGRHPVFHPAQGGLQKATLYQSIFPYPPLACSKSDNHYIKIGITIACDQSSCSLIPGLATVGAPAYACFVRRFWPGPWLEVRSKHCCLRLLLCIGNLTWKLDGRKLWLSAWFNRVEKWLLCLRFHFLCIIPYTFKALFLN